MISGAHGSGTVFFSGCPLGCVYCQNRKISNGENGVAVTTEELTHIYLKLQEMGANNINLVTPTHYALAVRESVLDAKKRGLQLPIVYNTGGYEKVETLKMLEGIVDIYLPDFKYFGSEISARYSDAPDYFEVAKKAMDEMKRQAGEPVVENGLMKRGVIVRHLVLPGYTEDSKKVIRYLYETYGDSIYLSIMNQYTPLENVKDYPEINRRITEEEYDEVVDFAIGLGVENAFIQEGETAEESFIPDFESFDVKKFLEG